MNPQLAEHDIGRAVWLEERRAGIGGSDAAAILGLSKWATPLAVWLDKTGRSPGKEQTEPMWWGSYLEEGIARRYSEKTGRKLWDPQRAVLKHPEHDCLLSTPDRLAIGERRGVEIKHVTWWGEDGWGEQGTDQVPLHVVIQCCHYMAITGFPLWDVVVHFAADDSIRIYTIRRDLDLEAMTIPKLVAWWDLHMVQGVEPKLDGSDQAREYIHSKYPEERNDQLQSPPPEAEPLAMELREVKGTIKVLEARKDQAEIAMKDLIGDAAGFDADAWKVTWKAPDAKRVTDWEKVAQALADLLAKLGQGERAQAFINEHTEFRCGSRRFLFTTKKEGR